MWVAPACLAKRKFSAVSVPVESKPKLHKTQEIVSHLELQRFNPPFHLTERWCKMSWM